METPSSLKVREERPTASQKKPMEYNVSHKSMLSIARAVSISVFGSFSAVCEEPGDESITPLDARAGRRSLPPSAVCVENAPGCLRADVRRNRIDLWRFQDDAHVRIALPSQPGGHGGADSNIMANFVQALRTNDSTALLTGTAESLASHRIVFAAEQARREARVVELDELV
jgi:hypothetical protein